MSIFSGVKLEYSLLLSIVSWKTTKKLKKNCDFFSKPVFKKINLVTPKKTNNLEYIKFSPYEILFFYIEFKPL